MFERPVRIVNNMHMHIGVLYHLGRRMVMKEPLEITGTDIDINYLEEVDRGPDLQCGISASYDNPAIVTNAIEEARWDGHFQVLRPSSQAASKGIELSLTAVWLASEV
jgi:hypothetical protein